jgi:thiamine biosynthesis lipoprotein
MAFPKFIDLNRRTPSLTIAFLLLTSWSLNSCSLGNSNSTLKIGRILMGTLVEVTVVGPSDLLQQAANSALDEIKRIEDLTSFHKQSQLNEINEKSGLAPVRVDPELMALIQSSLEISRVSNGAFDPTIGVISRLWNFSGPEGPRLPSPEEINQALHKVDWKKVQILPERSEIYLPEQGMAMDLGGISKGYALNQAEQIIKSTGIKSALINAGGDITAFGGKGPGVPWKIGIQDPRDTSTIVATVDIESGSVFTSGDYQRYFEKDGIRYHHILDPKTGFPASEVESVSVVAPDGVRAEGLSAGIFVLGPQRGGSFLDKMNNVSGLIVDSNGRLLVFPEGTRVFKLRDQ